MERTKFREYLNVGMIVVALIGLIAGTSYVSKLILKSMESDSRNYILRGIADVNVPVMNEVTNNIEEPYNDGTVEVIVKYYDVKGTKEDQEAALIKYDRTYMPSTGILYGCDNTFDVLAIAEGEVISIEESEMFSSIITIKHENNLISKYSSVKDVKVNVGDTVNTGEIIATSGENKVSTKKNNMLYFELEHNGEQVNPTDYFNKSLDEN